MQNTARPYETQKGIDTTESLFPGEDVDPVDPISPARSPGAGPARCSHAVARRHPEANFIACSMTRNRLSIAQPGLKTTSHQDVVKMRTLPTKISSMHGRRPAMPGAVYAIFMRAPGNLPTS